jgi:hypothetical protein
MSTLPDTHVIVIPSRGDCGLSAEMFMPFPALMVTDADGRPLKGMFPFTVQLPLEESHCNEINIAPSTPLIVKLPLVKVYVQNLMFIFLFSN